jgi:hydroxyethylthiazole kinase-like uncharacterized protein yjeF
MIPIKLPSAAEMAALDHATISSGVPSQQLMERAGVAILDACGSRFDLSTNSHHRALILCGPGNNGGDGLVIGRLLLERGVDVRLLLVGAAKYSADCVEQAGRFEGAGGKILIFGPNATGPAGCTPKSVSEPEVRDILRDSAVVVDALLGVGQRAAPHGGIKDLLEIVNSFIAGLRCGDQNRPHILSVDLPTGIDCDTGQVFEPHITADTTVTIQLMKRGMLQSPAFEDCGEIIVVDIGIDTSGTCEYTLVTQVSLPSAPVRARDINKGAAGRVLIIGGSGSMLGAPILSALGALRSGSGHVFVTRPEIPVAGWVCSRPLEVIDLPIVESELSLKDLDVVLQRANQVDAVVIGPGLGQSPRTAEALIAILSRLRGLPSAVILDADALNVIARNQSCPLQNNWIVTPHPGEAARLMGTSISEIQRDRFSAARELSRRLGCVAVLKGASTVIYSGGRGWVNSSGNSWMATPGSGDVLAGVIGALAAQGMAPQEAAQRGVFLHGRAGDLAHAAHRGPILASEIAARLPEAFGVP